MTEFVMHARAVVQATSRTRIITIDLAGREFPFEAGQAVHAGLASGTVRRPYSIACSPRQSAAAAAIELLVQIDDHTGPDPHLERVRPGTAMSIEGPFGSFRLPSPMAESHLLLVAGGTGIAPLRAIMWDTLERRSPVQISVAYSARNSQEFAYLEELQALHADRRIDLALTVTRESNTPWSGARGRISESFIRTALKTTDTRCLICGPATLAAEATELLKAEGVPEERIQRVQ